VASVRRNGRGFTLVEVLIVVSVIGLVMVALSAAFVVIVRTSPTNQQRADDSRALLSLTRWLPDDVSSTYTFPYDVTPTGPNGFTVDGSDPQCRPAAPPDEVSLLNLRWSETSTTYFVDYFWVREGSTADGLEQGRIVRFSCFGTSAGPTSSVESLSMSTELSELPGVPAWPVTVTPICPESLQDPSVTDPCGAANTITGGVTFTVSVWDDDGQARDILELVSVSKNVQGPPVGSSTGSGSGLEPGFNEPPVAGELYVEMYAGSSERFDLPVYDYDGTLDRLVITTDVDPVTLAGWAADPSVNDVNPYVDITVPVGTLVGSYEIPYDVQDRDGGAGSEFASPPGLITVTVIDSGTPADPIVNLPIPPPPPCVTAFDTPGATPNPVELKRANNNPNNDVNVLDEDVDIDITRSGACDPLVLRFVPDPEVGTQFFEEFSNSLEVTIRKNEYVWRVGDRLLELYEVKSGGNSVLRDTLILTVERAS
jgi:prepilin-type N-terminal cleavage/methylation domain-containing protein